MSSEGSSGAGSDGSGSDVGGYGDIGDILAYLNHWSFGTDGDYTGDAGYGGDNIGPVGSKEPEKDVDRATELIDTLMAEPGWLPHSRPAPPWDDASQQIEPYSGIRVPEGSLFASAGLDVDSYSGLPSSLERADPFTGLPDFDPFLDTQPPPRSRALPAFGTVRRTSLLSSSYLLADNDVIVCRPGTMSCLPDVKRDFNQSSLANVVQEEMDESNRELTAFAEGNGKIVGNTEVDMQKIAARAVELANSGDYRLNYTANQLRDHPIEVRRSAASAGLGSMASGGAKMVGSWLIIYGSGGLMLPLIGGMGFASGIAETSSGFALAISGADTTETIRMSGQLDYVSSLTTSPTSLLFGTTGLVLSHGDIDVSQRFAVVGSIAEDLSTFRGDPSKLYSALIPEAGAEAEGRTALLVKDVAALGYKAQGATVDQVYNSLDRDFMNRSFTEISENDLRDVKAVDAFRDELARTGRLDLAGVAGDKAAGGAGPGGGVDFSRHGGAFQQELKLHGEYTRISPWLLDKASTQSLNYSLKYQLESWAASGEQLVPIRSVKHIWISPTEAVRYTGH